MPRFCATRCGGARVEGKDLLADPVAEELGVTSKNVDKMKADKKQVWADWGDKTRKISRAKDAEVSKGPKGIELDKANDIMWYKMAVADETRNENLQNIARNYNRKPGAYKYEEKLGTLPKRINYLENRDLLRKDDPKIVGYKHGGKVKKMKNGGRGGGKSKCRGGGKATQGTGYTYR